MDLPRVSIVIPTYHRPRLLEETVKSITRVRYPLELVEIIIVHDPVDKAVEDIVSTYPKTHGIRIRSIECPVNNISSYRNTGVLNSSSDIVALVDDDIAVDPFFLERGVTYLLGDDKLACVCFPARSLVKSIDEKLNWRYIGVKTTHTYTTFSAMVCRRKILIETGLYREDMGPPLSIHEDWEFGSRIRKKGYKILVDGTLDVIHLLHMRSGYAAESGKPSIVNYVVSYAKEYIYRNWWTFFEVMKSSPVTQRLEYVVYALIPVLVLISMTHGSIYFITLITAIITTTELHSFINRFYGVLGVRERLLYPLLMLLIRMSRVYFSMIGFVLYKLKILKKIH